MIRLLIDEDVHGSIFLGLQKRRPELDLARVQDVGLSSTPDADILVWAASEGRIVVSADKKTFAVEAWNRVAQGVHMPGVVILRSLTIGQAITELEFLALAGSADDFRDRVIFVPL